MLREQTQRLLTRDWLSKEPALPARVRDWLEFAEPRIQAFWDRFDDEHVLYTASDSWHVATALHGLRKQKQVTLRNERCLEWGCGFGVVAVAAQLLGWQAHGIEAEAFLVSAGRDLQRDYGVEPVSLLGNFLPQGAPQLAEPEDPVVSLRHAISSGAETESHLSLRYPTEAFGVDEAGLIFVYSWPGEEYFLKQVFDRYASSGCLLLLYRGPQQLELYAKV